MTQKQKQTVQRSKASTLPHLIYQDDYKAEGKSSLPRQCAAKYTNLYRHGLVSW